MHAIECDSRISASENDAELVDRYAREELQRYEKMGTIPRGKLKNFSRGSAFGVAVRMRVWELWNGGRTGWGSRGETLPPARRRSATKRREPQAVIDNIVLSNKQKRRVFLGYGWKSEDIKCQCCGESNIMMIELDDVHGGGSTLRQYINGGRPVPNGGGGGVRVYNWLVRHGFPKAVPDGKGGMFPIRLQPMCSVCNKYKSRGQECPFKGKEHNINHLVFG